MVSSLTPKPVGPALRRNPRPAKGARGGSKVLGRSSSAGRVSSVSWEFSLGMHSFRSLLRDGLRDKSGQEVSSTRLSRGKKVGLVKKARAFRREANLALPFCSGRRADVKLKGVTSPSRRRSRTLEISRSKVQQSPVGKPLSTRGNRRRNWFTNNFVKYLRFTSEVKTTTERLRVAHKGLRKFGMNKCLGYFDKTGLRRLKQPVLGPRTLVYRSRYWESTRKVSLEIVVSRGVHTVASSQSKAYAEWDKLLTKVGKCPFCGDPKGNCYRTLKCFRNLMKKQEQFEIVWASGLLSLAPLHGNTIALGAFRPLRRIGGS